MIDIKIAWAMLKEKVQGIKLTHYNVSMAKSVLRIAAGISLVWPQSVVLAGLFLIVAEVLGIVEEVVEEKA